MRFARELMALAKGRSRSLPDSPIYTDDEHSEYCSVRRMDYLGYWSFRRRPFTETGAGALFFAGQPQREAIAGLNYLVASDSRVAKLVAAPRCGMTRLMKHVQQMRGLGDHAIEVVYTNNVSRYHGGVEAALCEALGLGRWPGDPIAEIAQAVQASNAQGISIVWMIDRCDRGTAVRARGLADNQENLALILGITSRPGDPISTTDDSKELVIHLESLSLADTLDYVREALRHAGSNRDVIADQAAVRLHELTGGKLADLAVMAEASLELAASHQMELVTAAVVEAIMQQQSVRAA